jgi:cobalt/nickel transport system permease protein
VLPRRVTSVPVAAAIGALISVPVAAATFTGLFAIGGNVDLDMGEVLAAMVGWHTVIGIGEAVITGLVVSAICASRPDLVHGARRALAARAEAGASVTPEVVA